MQEILNVTRSKFRIGVILSLALACVLIFPTVLLENEEIPTSNENLFFLGEISPSGVFDNTGNNSTHFSWNYILLNHKAHPIANVSIFGCALLFATNKTNPGFFSNPTIKVEATTNRTGFLSFTIPYLCSVIKSVTGESNLTISSFSLSNYSVSSKAFSGNASPKYDEFTFQSYNVQSKSGNVTNVYFSRIPSNLLGYYGTTPVILVCGSSGTQSVVNISYKIYNPQDKGVIFTENNLTTLKNGQIYTLENYNLLKEFNEADNVTFYATGQVNIGSLFNSESGFFTPPSISVSTGISFPAADIALLVALFLVLIIYVPMFNNNVYKRYLSLPEKRRRTILVQIGSAMIVSSIFSGIALGASFILSYLLLNIVLSLLAIVFTFVIIETALLVFVSIYTILSAYFPGRSGARTFLTIFLVFGYPLISEISQSLLLVFPLSDSLFVVNSSYLYRPLLENIRTYNILTSVLPVLNIEQLNNYLLRTPFTSVIMYNHLSIFDLSPIIFISSILGFSALFIYLAIRRLNKI